MNRIDKLFREKKEHILSVYFTAGFPDIVATAGIVKSLSEAGADMVEIGMPFSDPVADGPVIQKSNETALRNGMNIKKLFVQLQEIRNEVDIPIILMGYLNPVMQFGFENFCMKCSETGIDGVILPDLPPQVYIEEFQGMFDRYGIYNILLISPQSDEKRIHEIDYISRGFIYMVSSSGVTGAKGSCSQDQIAYFDRVRKIKLKNPCLIGFGISGHDSFAEACKYSSGGIIGSAFVNLLREKGYSADVINQFVKSIRG